MKKLIGFCMACACIVFSVQAQPNFDLVGFATLNGGTSGGEGGQTVTVNNYSDLKSYAESSNSYIIMVEGTITNGSGGGVLNVKSNKSIIGVGGSAFLSGISINISSANNIILRNFKQTLVGTSNPKSINDGDCIGISGSSKNIWIDHLELYSENPDQQTDIDKYDGLIDIKGQTGFITISWCYLHDHHKGGLVGAGDSDLHDDRLVTLHHNYYNKVKLRVPMYRGATGHFFNNYIKDAQKASEIRAGTCVRIEKNYYDNFREFAIYTTSDSPGKTERIDNYLSKSQSRSFPSSCSANIPYDYAAVLTNNAQDVKSVVQQYAGVGKVGGDCNGDVLGTAYLDECGECVGGNTGKTACVLDCNGDRDGSASIDECGVCSGGNTGVQACTGVLQAENFCQADGTVDIDNAGFQGAGFLNLINTNGSSAIWVVYSETTQSTTLGIRYANGGGSARPMSVSVNGNTQATFQASPTGEWSTWQTENVLLNLSSGVNTIVFSATTGDGGPNMDLFSLEENVLASSCDEDCNGDIGGVAGIDLCGACSGGNTGIQPNSTCEQQPFGGTPHPIPGVIQAEDFDEGVNGLAYYETTDENQGGATYRSEGVDLEDCTDDGAGYNLSWTVAGEWLEYTVDVQSAGLYDLDLRVACNGDDRTLSFEMDGEELVSNVAIPSTGGWQEWETITVPNLSLSEGEQVLRLTIGDVDYININYLEFRGVVTSTGSIAPQKFHVFPNPTTGVVQWNTETHYCLENAIGIELQDGKGSEVDLSNYPNGVYLIKIKNRVIKIMKK